MHSSWGGGDFARLNVHPPMDKEVKLDTCRYRLIDRKKEMEVKKRGGGGENDDCECELTRLS